MGSEPLNKQPFETLDRISSFVDHPSDLLSLALTTSLWHRVIIPDHLQFRHVRCDVREQHLWMALAARPFLASRLRRLEVRMEARHAEAHRLPDSVSYGRVDVVPACLATPRAKVRGSRDTAEGEEEEEATLCDCICVLTDAVEQMPALTRFCWEGDGSACPDALRTLFAVLATSCPAIHELHINSVETMGNTLRFNSFCQPLWHLTELTRVSISVTHRVGYHTHTWVPGLLDMLIENCPSLVDLHISVRCFHNAPIARLLLDAHWHLLRRLTLRGFMTLFEPYVNESEQTHVLERFLSRMPNLECLCIQNPMLQTFRGGLPHNIRSLRSLSLPFMCRVPRSVAQQLRCLGGIPFIFYTPSGPVWSLLAHMSALRVLFVEGMTDALAAQLFNIVPDLERLYCRLWHGSGPRGAFSPPDNLTPIFLTTLSRFTSLTHLSQLSLSDKETLEAVLKALTRAPRLRYVEMYIRPGACAQWITVERNTDGSYKGWEYTEDIRDLGFNDCAGLFRGII